MRLLQENLEDLDDNASAGPSLVQRTEIDDKRHSNSIKIASFELRSRHGDPSSGQVRGRSDYHGEESHERRSSPRAFKANKTLRSLLSYWEELQDMIDTPQQERSAEEGERSGTRATQPPIDNRDTARTHEPKVKREHKKPTIDEWIEGTEVSTRDMQQDPASRPSHDERESHHPRVVVEDPRREHAAPSIADWIANTEVSTRDEEYEASHPRTFPKETEVRTSSPVAEKRSRSRVVDENMDRSPQVQQPSPKHYHEGLRTMIHATRSPSPSEREKDRYMPPSPPYSTTSVVDQDHNVHNVVHHHHIHHHHDAPRDASRDTRERRDGRDGRDGRDAAPRHAPIEAPPPLPRRPSTHAHDVDPRRPRMVDEFWHILQASGGVHWETRKKRKDRLVIKQYVGPVMCRQGETKWSDLTVAGSAWTSLPRRYCSRSVLLDLRYDFKDDKHDFHVIEELDYVSYTSACLIATPFSLSPEMLNLLTNYSTGSSRGNRPPLPPRSGVLEGKASEHLDSKLTFAPSRWKTETSSNAPFVTGGCLIYHICFFSFGLFGLLCFINAHLQY